MWLIILVASIFGFIVLCTQLLIRPWRGKILKHDGISYASVTLTTKGGVYGVRIGIDVVNPCFFEMKRETIIDRFFKQIGISREFQVGLDEFDKEVYIASDSPALHDALKSNALIRKNILSLLTSMPANCNKVVCLKCTGTRLWIQYKCGLEGVTSAPTVCVPLLQEIATELCLNAPTHPVFSDDKAQTAAVIKAICYGLLFPSLCVGFFLFVNTQKIVAMDGAKLTSAAANVSILITGSLVLVTLYLLKNTSRAHLVLLTVLGLGSLGSYITTWSVMQLADTEFDGANPEVFTSRVNSKWSTTGRHASSYIRVKNWNDEGEDKTFEPDRHTFNSLKVGDPINVYQKPGYLGYRWISGIAKAEK